MKTVLFAAAAVLAVSAGTAFAAEGAGDPFPYRAPGVVTTMTPGRPVMKRADTDPFPFRADPTVVKAPLSPQLVDGGGAQAGVETANSLPKGFSDGTASYVENQRTSQYLMAQAALRASSQMAHNQVPAAPHG